jgi:predicted alpha-1,6-mannanase (GH76 family)
MTQKITREELIAEINLLMDGLKEHLLEGAKTVPESLLFKGSSVIGLEALLESYKEEAVRQVKVTKANNNGTPPTFN